jgi:hypothetical protein
MFKRTISQMALLLTGVALVPTVYAAESSFTLPESGLTVEDRVTLLAIDDLALRDRNGVTLTLNKPTVRKEPVLTPERGDLTKPDSMASHFYGTVLHDAGKFRMWYYAVSYKEGAPGNLWQGPVCYAESDDGIAWTKPNLGQVEIGGSTDNNAVKLSDEATQCAAIIIDEEETDPNRRYKMVFMALSHTWVFRTATSADGITWKVQEKRPTDKFLEMGSFYRFGDQWVVHGQGIGKDAEGNPEGRQGYASISTDFVNWENQNYLDTFRVPEPEDVAKRGLVGDYPQVHLGVGGAPFGNVVVGLWGIWHNPSEADRRKKGWYGAGLITCDLGLLVSNDGVTFREPVKGNIYISGDESPVTPVPGIDDPTILCQANGILNVGDEIRIYHGRWRNATVSGVDYYAEVALATLPRDRWGSLHVATGQAAGSVWSAPVTLPAGGCEIRVNAEGAGQLVIELADESGALLPEFSGENMGIVQRATGVDHGVKFLNGALADLGGKTVRLKIGMTGESAKLYAVYLDGK